RSNTPALPRQVLVQVKDHGVGANVVQQRWQVRRVDARALKVATDALSGLGCMLPRQHADEGRSGAFSHRECSAKAKAEKPSIPNVFEILTPSGCVAGRESAAR